VTGGEYGGTYCFNRWTGEQKWYSKRNNTHFEEGIPALYKNAAYLVEHTNIKSIDLGTGSIHWEIEVNEEYLPLDVQVLDLSGKLYYSGELKSKSSKIDCSGYPSGVYIVTFNKQDLIKVTKKLVKE